MGTEVTTDLDTRRSQMTGHLDALTATRDAARAALASAGDAHREALMTADASGTAKANADRRRRREALADAEADLETANGWLREALAEVNERDRMAAADQAARDATAAHAKFRDALAAMARGVDERVSLLASAAEEQAADLTRLRAARDAARTHLAHAHGLSGASVPFMDPTEADLENALRASDPLIRAWRPDHVTGATMLTALVDALRATRPEFRTS